MNAPPAQVQSTASLVARTDFDWVEIATDSTPIATCSGNVAPFLKRQGVVLRYNAWLERVEIRWPHDAWRALTDRDIDSLMTTAGDEFNRFRPSEMMFRRVVGTLARANTVDPALDHLDALENAWDGTARLVTWLTATCGVPCDPYHQAVGKNIIGGMVRRLRHPGCKHDTMAVLTGWQGQGKSSLARILALNDEWFTDSVTLGVETKELIPALRGKAVVEISEMRSRSEIDAIKAMVSRQVDAARLSYGREITEAPRRCIFIGTSNNDAPLIDNTGNRRFLPVRVEGEINFAWLTANLDQLIGEAAARETAGETFDMPREVWGVAAEHQESARSRHDFEEILERVFAVERGAAWVASAELVTFVGRSVGRSVEPTRYAPVMRQLGFKPAVPRIEGITVRGWLRGEMSEALRLERLTQPQLPTPANVTPTA